MRWLHKVLRINSTASVKNWRENWLNKVLTVNSTASVRNWRENWLNKVLTVNSTVAVSSPKRNRHWDSHTGKQPACNRGALCGPIEGRCGPIGG
eukprot:706181-Prorocentrum_minimum.AAC.1